MKKIKFAFGVLCFMCVPLFFVSCNLKDLTTIDVPIGKVEIKIPVDFSATSPAPMGSKINLASTNFIAFSGKSAPINLEDNMFHNLQNYLGDQITIIVTDVKIQVTVSNTSGTIVRNFTSKTKEEAAVLYNYAKSGNADLGVEFSDSNLTNYAKNIFLAIQNGKTVTIEAAGETDIDMSEITGATVAIVTVIPTLKAQVKLLK